MTIEISQNSIALLHRNQIESLSVAELKLAAKEYNLRGYSKLKKADLANLVYETSDILRQTMLNQAEKSTQLEKEKAEVIRAKLIEQDGGIHAFSQQGIENRVNKIRSTKAGQKMTSKDIGESVAASLYDYAKQANYSNKYIAKDLTSRIRTAIKLNEKDNRIKPEIYTALKSKWDSFVRLNNINIVDESLAAKDNYAEKALKTFTQQQTEQIVNWAIENLNNKSHYLAAISFSILTGRRMIEIYGTEAQYFINQPNLISIKGVAKKKQGKEDTVYNFIPLHDAETLVNFINKQFADKRKYTPIQVKRTISSKISRKFPTYLKDIGIEKFKDCRDFFAGVTYQNFVKAGKRRPEKFVQHNMAHDSLETTASYDKYDTGIWGYLESYKTYTP